MATNAEDFTKQFMSQMFGKETTSSAPGKQKNITVSVISDNDSFKLNSGKVKHFNIFMLTLSENLF